jgi:dTDP-glucose pyrophosphorylase
MELTYLNDRSIASISDKEMSKFQSIVAQDVKSPESTQEVKDYLHSHLDLWLYSLQLLRREIELQLSCQKTKIEMHKNNLKNNTSDYSESQIVDYINKQNNWRMTAVKFLSNIERRTLYVKMLIKNS